MNKSPAQAKWIVMIHVAKRETKMTDDQYRLLLQGAANVNHANEVETWEQYTAVLNAFKAHGFRFKPAFKRHVTKEERPIGMITAKQEYYIKGLWNLASRKKDEKSLRAIIKRIAKVDDISFLEKKYATAVILALRDISEKAGYNPDSP